MGIACATAMALAFGITLMMAKQYTASARILIDSGSGVDPRSAIAVSSIYLESLKTYEAFAASEQLFQRAVDRFQLRDGRGSLQSLHSSVLKVRVLPGTRLLEIQCTLPDPQKAHALAVYLAEETVQLSRGVSGNRTMKASRAPRSSSIWRRLGWVRSMRRSVNRPGSRKRNAARRARVSRRRSGGWQTRARRRVIAPNGWRSSGIRVWRRSVHPHRGCW